MQIRFMCQNRKINCLKLLKIIKLIFKKYLIEIINNYYQIYTKIFIS